jgi:hypothetical protein
LVSITATEYVFNKESLFVVVVPFVILLDTNEYPIAPKLAADDHVKIAFDVKLVIFKLGGASAYAKEIDDILFTIDPDVLNRSIVTV